MKFLFVIMLGMTAFAFADSFESKIQEIDEGNKTTLLKFENGRVAFINSESKMLLPNVGDRVRVKLNSRHELVAGSLVEKNDFSEAAGNTSEKISYDPTVVDSPLTAAQIFGRMNRRTQIFSQCYNRAHVWSYEEFKRSGLKSKKLFMFFTSDYIRKYRYKWWFHVSPMILVRDTEAVVERVIDREFTKSPLAVKAWTDMFIKSKRVCPVVYHYSDYRDHQQTEHCYLMPVSMYYWQPRDMENQERTGGYKTDFVQADVNHAYREAF